MSVLEIERSNGVVTLTLNRPDKKNAANMELWRALLDAFLEIRERPEDRVVVLTGAGGDFCSGADLADLAGRTEGHQLHWMRHLADVALALHRLPKPTLAKVTGVAAGAGCNMALCCDLIVASSNARFTQIFPKRGLSLDFGGSWLLPRLIGMAKAKELAFFGDIISGQEAYEIGLINRAVDEGEIDKVVEDWAGRLVKGPPIALSMTKSQLNSSFSMSMDQALENEAAMQSLNLRSNDMAEAMKAFAEKREPNFLGW